MFFYAHSGLRYLVLLAGVLTLGYALYGAVAGLTYDRTMLRLARAFMALTHLQLLLGVALLFTPTVLSRPHRSHHADGVRGGSGDGSSRGDAEA